MKKLLLLLTILLLPTLAWAADGPFKLSLTPPPSDLSMVYLSYLFGIVDGVLRGTGSQIIGTMFGVFNVALLSLGGVILMYILIQMTLKTAHEGEVMGREGKPLWTPIRSVVGVALLVPKATGYSAIQIFVMWMAVQGIGAADSIWNAALDYLQTGGVLVQQADTQGSAVPQEIKTLSGNIFQSLVCMYGLQNALTQKAKAEGTPPPPPFINSVVPVIGADQNSTVTVQFPGGYSSANPKGNLSPAWSAYTGACGYISWNRETLPNAGGVSAARIVAVQQVILDLAGWAQYVVNNAQSPNPLPLGNQGMWSSGTRVLLPPDLLVNSSFTYVGLMRGPTSMNQNMDTNDPTTFGNNISDMRTYGWIAAGAYYSALISANVKTSGSNIAVNLPMSTYNAPSAKNALNGLLKEPYLSQVSNLLNPSLTTYAQDAAGYNAGGGGTVGPGGAVAPTKRVADCSAINGFSMGELDKVPQLTGITKQIVCTILTTFTATIPNGYDRISGAVNIPQDSGDQYSNVNPLYKMSKMGDALIDICFIGWAVLMVVLPVLAFALGSVPSMGLATVPSVIATWAAPMITTVLVALIAPAAVLSFYIPLIPFIIFTFASVGWFTAVIESMVAAPLVALGVVHPEGQHEIFGKAEQAIMLLLNLFLRPSLMIFGFIAGIILSYIAIWLLNFGFGIAFQGIIKRSILSGAMFTPLIGGIASIIVYTLVAMGIVNQCFKLIGDVPDRVTRWLSGGQQEQFGGAHGAEEIKGGVSGAGQVVGQGSGKGLDAAQGFGGERKAWGAKGTPRKPGGPDSGGPGDVPGGG
jgi:conjugal transfer/type IV secretion protein DotA/TraY